MTIYLTCALFYFLGTKQVPVWQIAPIISNEEAVMFNLHSESNRREALDHMMEYKVPAFTALIQLVQDGSKIRPSSILFYPGTFQYTIGMPGF